MAFVVKPKAATPAASVKDGTYPAAVTGIKQFVNTYGERIGFEFTILSGPFKGEKVLRSTAPQLTRQSKLAELRKYTQGARAQLDLIENTFRLIGDQILTMHSPAELGGQLDELMDGVEAVRSTATEHRQLLGQTS